MEVFSDLYSSFTDVWGGAEELNLCKDEERLIKNNYIDFISYFQKLKIHTFTNWTTAKICFKVKHAAKKGIRPFESTALLKNNKGRSDDKNHIYILPSLSTPLQRLNKAFNQIYSFFQVHRLSLLTLHGVRGRRRGSKVTLLTSKSQSCHRLNFDANQIHTSILCKLYPLSYFKVCASTGMSLYLGSKVVALPADYF